MGKRIDKKIVEKFKLGNMEAFEEIYNFYNRPLHYFAFSIVRNEADAEEVLQNTFIRVVQSIDALQSVSSFHSWLYTIAYNQAITLYNKNKNNISLTDEVNFEEIIAEDEEPKDLYKKKELKDLIQKEIESMSDKYVQVAMLRYFDDLSVNEISSILSIPVGTVKTRLLTIRKELKRGLNRNGVSSTRMFSVALYPAVVAALHAISSKYELTNEVATRVYNNIISAPKDFSTIGVSGASALGTLGASMFQTKIIFAISLLGLGYGGYQVVKPQDDLVVSEIAYNDTLTNKSVEVSVKLNEQVNADSVKISKDSASLDVVLEDKQILFTANENGSYKVVVGSFEDTITISNIDKEGPELADLNYEDNVLDMLVKDKQTEVNYEKSYFTLNDNTYKMTKDQKIEGNFEGTIYFYLYDQLDNVREYKVEITKDEEITKT